MATRTTTKFRVRNDVWDSITPPPWVQDNIAVPQGDWKPAPYLPVLWTQSNRDAGEDGFVLSVGKPVALDRQGYLVPAGLRGKWNKTTATVVLTYTSTDYDYGVIDLVTGSAYATDGTTTYTALEVAEALIERGLVPEDVIAANPPTSDAHVTAIIEAFISLPVGVASMNYYKWAGRPEDLDQTNTNYSKQNSVVYVTETQMKMPWRVASSTSSDAFDVSAITTKTAASADGDFPQPGEVWEIGGLEDLSRYSLDGEEIVAFTLANKPVAKNTSRTPISCDVSGVLLKEKTALTSVKKAGDWFLDGEVGLLFIHADTWATLLSDDSDPTFSYWYYDDAGTGSDSEQWIYFDGEATPGALVSIDEMSNFVVKGTAGDILDSTDPALGRVMWFWSEPRQLLDKVKTAFSLSYMTKAAKMPGSATSGYSDMITLADEEVADRIISVNIRVI